MISGFRSWRARRIAAKSADLRAPGDIACRNCGADAPGAFCPSCGQETRVQLPRVGQFMREAAGRYVAFDGRMWRTLGALLVHPGFLTREYLAGRRKRYVRPARLVLVLAIVMFAAFGFFADTGDFIRINDRGPGESAAAPAKDGKSAAPKGIDPVLELDGEPVTIGSDARGLRIDDDMNLSLTGAEDVLGGRIGKRLNDFNHLDREQKGKSIVAGMIRYGPYAFIALLPAFALIMQLLYLGRAKRYPQRPRRYAEHLVFAAHDHAFVALVLTLVVVIPYWPAKALLLAWTAWYLLAAMHAVYGGRWIGVFARAFVASFVYLAFFGIAMAGLVVAAVVLR